MKERLNAKKCNGIFQRRIISVLLLLPLIFAPFATSTVEAQTDSIALGDQVMVSNGVYKVSAVVTGNIKTISINATDVKIKLTQVSGSGFSFKNGVVNSTTAHTTPNTSSNYVSVQLTVNSAEAAMTALDTVRYTDVKSSGSHVKITGDATTLASGDYYLDGHYYTLSSSGSMSWKQGMEWAFNLMTTDSTRYSGYKSYPVVVNSVEENQMLTNIWYNNGSTTKRQIFLPAVPVEVQPGSGSITVSGIEGNRTVTVVGEPYVKTENIRTSPYGHGSAWKWLAGTPNEGEALPEESFTSGKGVYWSSGNPTDGGMVYFGHPSDGAYWDDLAPKAKNGSWGTNVWSAPITNTTFSGHMYALAEWEPMEGHDISATKDLEIQTHTHSWEYTTKSVNRTDDTILAYCTGTVANVLCSHQGTAQNLTNAVAITLKSDSPTYSGTGITDGWKYGEEITINIENSNDWKSIVGENSLPEIKYTGTGATNYNSSTAPPTKAGTYEASLKKGEAIVKIPFEIRNEIQFMSNGGSGTMQKVTTVSNSYQLPLCSFRNPLNKEFVGWSTTSTGEVITADSISINSNINLYAIWKTHNHRLYTIVLQSPVGDSSGITAQYCDCGFYIIKFDNE